MAGGAQDDGQGDPVGIDGGGVRGIGGDAAGGLIDHEEAEQLLSDTADGARAQDPAAAAKRDFEAVACRFGFPALMVESDEFLRG